MIALAKYSMSFTTGGLFCQESEKMAQLYLEEKNWDVVREKSLKQGLPQTRTQSSATRIYREISARLKTLADDALELVAHGSIQERAHILWLAVCCRYLFIQEFAVEVIRERFLTLRYDLSYQDFDAFFNAKADWHEDLDAITPMTRNKLRQNLFRMLREADILSANNSIQPAVLAPHLERLVSKKGIDMIRIFPVLDSGSTRKAQ